MSCKKPFSTLSSLESLSNSTSWEKPHEILRNLQDEPLDWKENFDNINNVIKYTFAMAPLKRVAGEAGVSVPTVSRVINKYQYVRETTRPRVLDAIQELSYHPNTVARNLKQGKTNTIGFILPDISNSFFGMLTLSIEKKVRRHGYHPG